MKKIISFFLSVMLMCTMTIAVSAAESPVNMSISKDNAVRMTFSMDFSDTIDISELEIEVVMNAEIKYNTYCDAVAVIMNVSPYYVSLTSLFHSSIQKSDGKTYIKMSFPDAGLFSNGKLEGKIRIVHEDWSLISEDYECKVYIGGKKIYPQNKLNSESLADSDENAQFKVKSTYVAGVQSEKLYSVDVSWGSMAFTYAEGNEGTWNPLSHEYTDTAPAGWSCEPDANKITVTNRSNVALDAALSYVNKDGFDLTAEFVDSNENSITKLALPTAESYGETAAGPRSDIAYMQITGGTITSDTASETTLGTITLTISDAE